MIRNQWYAVLDSNEVKPGKLVGVTRMREKLVLARDHHGEVFCLADHCPHRGAALSRGKLLHDRVQCPFHGFEFDPTGRCRLIPANGKDAPVAKAFQVQSYPVRDVHGFLWIWWGDTLDDLPPIQFFDSIGPEMSYATLRDHWRTHYSRAIENQLDVVHLPFVHHNTIGRGSRTLVDGPLAEWESGPSDHNLLNLWVYNRVDDGTAPRKPDDLPPPARRPLLQFRFPNIWHNWLSPSVHLVAAFAPIDDENTMMYIRMYQNFMRVPGLKQLVNRASMLGNLFVERQDKRVVETQLPKRTALRMDEKLIQGDGPIIAYRRRREELMRVEQE